MATFGCCSVDNRLQIWSDKMAAATWRRASFKIYVAFSAKLAVVFRRLTGYWSECWSPPPHAHLSVAMLTKLQPCRHKFQDLRGRKNGANYVMCFVTVLAFQGFIRTEFWTLPRLNFHSCQKKTNNKKHLCNKKDANAAGEYYSSFVLYYHVSSAIWTMQRALHHVRSGIFSCRIPGFYFQWA